MFYHQLSNEPGTFELNKLYKYYVLLCFQQSKEVSSFADYKDFKTQIHLCS